MCCNRLSCLIAWACSVHTCFSASFPAVPTRPSIESAQSGSLCQLSSVFLASLKQSGRRRLLELMLTGMLGKCSSMSQKTSFKNILQETQHEESGPTKNHHREEAHAKPVPHSGSTQILLLVLLESVILFRHIPSFIFSMIHGRKKDRAFPFLGVSRIFLTTFLDLAGLCPSAPLKSVYRLCSIDPNQFMPL